jgi:hypothetical protein
MRPIQCVGCNTLACPDVRHDCYRVPDVELEPEEISIIMISEAAPPDPADYYYAGGDSLFERTTLQAFHDAGFEAQSFKELIDRGVYFTTAVKCGKVDYGLKSATVDNCSRVLEQELALFPNAEVYLLMGDVAIRAVNAIARRAGEGRVIPAGSTYKIRGGEYEFHGKRVIPSYLQAGPAYFIERSKRQVIAEDITTALDLTA